MTRFSFRLPIIVALALIGVVRFGGTRSTGTADPDRPFRQMAPAAPGNVPLASTFGNLPLSFEMNRGQTDQAVAFLARGDGYGLFLTGTEAVLRLRGPAQNGHSAVVRMRLAGASEQPQITGVERLPGTSNYYNGKDPRQWRTDVPHFAKVKYTQVYPGIDLVYYGNQRQLEYDFVVAPGADPGAIALAFSGATAMTTNAAGHLVLQTAQGEVQFQAPVVYQTTGGARHEVAGRYAVKPSGVVAFELADYDRTAPLVIDPVLVYSTLLGGTSQDTGNGIAVDGSGSAYLVGDAGSATFPTLNSNQSLSGGEDAFIAKFNATGTALVYSTFIGGSTAGTSEHGYDIAVDASGNAYVVGTTFSPDFPITANAFQPTKRTDASQETAFVAKLSASGTLAYSTFLSGQQGSRAYSIATDGTGNVYVTGPSVNGYPVTTSGAFTASASNTSGFLTKLNTNASGTASLVYSTYLGPSGFAEGHSIAVDAAGNAYVAGITNATGFASTGAFQTTFAGGTYDAFVAKFNTNVSGAASRVYATYVGGSGVDIGGSSRTSTSTGNHGIAIDASGNAYVIGRTDSTNFPVANAFQPANAGYFDAFLTKVNSTGSTLVYSTYLGGSNTSAIDEANAVAVNAVGNAYVIGHTESTNFPLASPLSIPGSTTGGVFVTKFTPAGNTLVYSIRLGRQVAGSSDQDNYGEGIALDAAGNAFLTGGGRSSYPTTTGAFQPTAAGITDAFLSQVADPTIIGRVVDQGGNPISTASVSLTGTPSGTTTADANGYFTFGLLTQGSSYTVSVTIGGDTLTPQTVTNLQKNVRLQFVSNTPSAALDRTSLTFAATNAGSSFSNQTDAQAVHLTQTTGPAVGWTATSSKPWLTVTPASGSGAGTLTVSVKYDTSLPASGTVTGAITLALTGALNTAGPINVTLNVLAPSAPPSEPIGTVDTPSGDGSVLAGSIAVTGWALDNMGVAKVELWRDAQPGETTPTYTSPLGPSDPRNGKIFIANATFVEGARPDLEGLYATMPYAYRGGWGYLMLTWGLYNQGNGTYKLYAFAVDKEGNTCPCPAAHATRTGRRNARLAITSACSTWACRMCWPAPSPPWLPDMTVPNEILGVALGFVVGIVLGLLGGGGSILAVPIFLYVFRVAPKPAIAMSLAVVGMSAFVGFLGHWRQGSVNLRIGLPFGVVAMGSAFLTARVSDRVPEVIQLSLFALFAFTAAIVMLFDSLRAMKPDAQPGGSPHFTPVLAIEAVAVGALTALIGAGGGFVIVPALVYLAGVPVKQAVGSSLLIITLNAMSGFAGYIGQVPIDWSLVGMFTGVAAVGAIVGTRLNRHVSQVRIKQGFALLILILGSYLVIRKFL